MNGLDKHITQEEDIGDEKLCYFCNCEITEENDCFDPELEYVCCIKCYKEQGFKEMTSDEYLW